MAVWDKITSAGNVEDRRGLGGIGILGSGIGIIGIIITLALNYFGINVDPNTVNQLLGQLDQTVITRQDGAQPEEFRGADDYEVFASRVIGSNNDMWSNIFRRNNMTYSEPRLVLFRNATNSACGIASSDIGPHYCPADRTIYLDETFFDELQNRFGAEGGDVAEAYVLAHEAGHHAQNELGIMNDVANRQRAEPQLANELSIRQELQADCFAGLWANSVAHLGVIQPGEINEAIDAAAAVGDDNIQKSAGGRVNPETWTHGSSEDRVNWFNRGYESGNVAQCNTFELIFNNTRTID